jgi:hypothetical protein
MAVADETPCTLLLLVDLEHALPDDDDAVQAVLVSYGLVFDKKKKPS